MPGRPIPPSWGLAELPNHPGAQIPAAVPEHPREARESGWALGVVNRVSGTAHAKGPPSIRIGRGPLLISS